MFRIKRLVYLTILISLFTINLCFPTFIFAETIILKSGQKIEGKILEKTKEYLKIDFYGVPLTYFFDEVENIDGEKILLSKNDSKNIEIPTKKNELFPFAIGNTWYYNFYFASSKDKNSPIDFNKSILLPQSHIIKITGKEIIEGYDVFIQEMHDDEGKLLSREYLSEKENSLFCHKRELYKGGIKKVDKIYSPPEVNARFDLNPGDKWTGEDGLQFEFIGKEHIDTPAGKFEAYVFETSIFEDGTEFYINKYYAPGIGLVSEITVIKAREFNSGAQTELIKYNIVATEETPLSFTDGLIYLKDKKYQQAIEEFQKTIQQYPNYAEAYNNLGVAYHSVGQYQQAIDYYQKAIEINPNYADAYANLGGVYNSLGQYQKAMDYCQKSMEADPNYFKAYVNLTGVFISLGQYQQAMDSCQKAIQLDPNSVEAYKNLGLIYYSLGQYQQSVDYYQKAIQIDPNYIKAYYGIAISLTRLGKHNDAISFLQKAIEKNPNDAHSCNYLGALYSSMGQFESALSYLKKAIEINPNFAEAYLSLGVAYGNLGRRNEAIENLQKAKELLQQKKDYQGVKQVEQLLDTLP